VDVPSGADTPSGWLIPTHAVIVPRPTLSEAVYDPSTGFDFHGGGRVATVLLQRKPRASIALLDDLSVLFFISAEVPASAGCNSIPPLEEEGGLLRSTLPPR